MIKIDHMISLTVFILLIFYVIHTSVQLTYPFEKTTQAELAVFKNATSKHFNYTALGEPSYYFQEGTVVIPAGQPLEVYGFILKLLEDKEKGRQVYWANYAYTAQLHSGVFLLDADEWEDIQRLRGEYGVTAYKSTDSFNVRDVRVLEYAPKVLVDGTLGNISTNPLDNMKINFTTNINSDHDFLIMACDSSVNASELQDFFRNGGSVFAIDNASFRLNSNLGLGFDINNSIDSTGPVNISGGGWYLNQTTGSGLADRHYYDNITNADVPLATWSGNCCYTYTPYEKGFVYLFLPHLRDDDGVTRLLGNAILYSASRSPEIQYNGYHSYNGRQWVIPLNDQDNISDAYALAYKLLNNSTTVNWTMIGSGYPTVDGKYPAHMGAFITGNDTLLKNTNLSFRSCNNFFTKNVWTANRTPEIAVSNNGDNEDISDILNKTGFNHTCINTLEDLRQYDILILPDNSSNMSDTVIEFAKRGGIVLAIGKTAGSVANSRLFGPVSCIYFNETKAMYADHYNITDPSTQFYSGDVTAGYVVTDYDNESLTVLGSWDRNFSSNVTFARGKNGWKSNIYLFFPYDFNGETARIIPDLAFMSVFNSSKTDWLREQGAPAPVYPVVHRELSSIPVPCNDVDVRIPVMVEVAS